MSDCETVIRGGMVVDGTGGPGRSADVGISGGRIVAIDEGGLAGRQELDAAGQVVAPGFIDIHTHYDAQVFWDPRLSPSCYHGVTSVVAGNCGFSIAPVRTDYVELLARTLQHVEDMSFDTLSAGVPWESFETFPQYLDAVEQHRPALNYGCYVGHTAVRLYVMGEAGYERPARPDEIQRMQQVVDGAMAAGAMGFATSASTTHIGDKGRPVPSRLGDLEELRALLEPVGRAARGVVALLPGGPIGQEDVFRLQREVGRPFTWTALMPRQGYPHEDVVAANDAAWEGGARVWPQVSCRPAAFQINLREPFPFNSRPSFAALMGKPLDERMAAYGDPSWRAAAWSELNESAAQPFNWKALSVAESDSRPDLISRAVIELADGRGGTPLDVILDISLADGLQTRFRSVMANDDPDAIAWLLPRDHLLLGVADSGAHVSQICDACFATDFLGHWVRDRQIMPLERAVHKLTGEPASFYGLHDRGTIAVGQAADICVFDPAVVAPGPLRRTRDFPANGERLTADGPAGVTHVLVNGILIRRDGQPAEEGLAAGPGRRLRPGA